MRCLSVLTLLLLAVAILPAGGADGEAWGSLKGKIVWNGDIPKPTEINVDKDQEHCLSKGKIHAEQWVIGKDKGIRWVLVWLIPDPAGNVKQLPIHPNLKQPKDKAVSLDQPCCMFIPHVLGLRE